MADPEDPIVLDNLLPDLEVPSQLRVLSNMNHPGYAADIYFLTLDELVLGNDDIDTTRGILVLIPLYARLASKSDDNKYYSSKGGQKKDAHYDKMIVCADPLAPSGDNICVILIGNGHNEEIWSACLKERDNGKIGKAFGFCTTFMFL